MAALHVVDSVLRIERREFAEPSAVTLHRLAELCVEAAEAGRRRREAPDLVERSAVRAHGAQVEVHGRQGDPNRKAVDELPCGLIVPFPGIANLESAQMGSPSVPETQQSSCQIAVAWKFRGLGRARASRDVTGVTPSATCRATRRYTCAHACFAVRRGASAERCESGEPG